MVRLGNDWDQLLGEEFQKPYYLALREFLLEEYRRHTVYPDKYKIFAALKQTPYSQVKVVLLGQDPYHGPGQAHGLAFSVPPGVAPPPSLVNIFQEIKNDLGGEGPPGGCLSFWAEQGVLLLNTCLTVRAHKPASHRGRGWEVFTDAILQHLNAKESPVVFLLWGRLAQSKARLLSNPRHLLLQAAHPSPLAAARGFFGSAPFSRTNRFLEETGQKPISWQIPKEPR